MANIFGFMDVTRPGKGVEKDRIEKKGLPLFGELLWRKLWKYIKLSLLYFVTCIPTVIIMTIIGMYAFSGQVSLDPSSASLWLDLARVAALVNIIFFAGSITHAGFSYILRNFVREEHAWLWEDFWKRTKANFKQALIVYIIDIAISFCIVVALNFYYSKITTSNESIYIIMSICFVVATLFYALMHDYIWPMMVTIDLSIKNLYKNAALFTLLGFGKNFISLGLRLIAFFLAFNYLSTTGVYFIYAILLLAASHLLSHVYTYPYIKKYLIDPQMNTSEETDENEIDDNEDDNEDDIVVDNLPDPDELIMPIDSNDVATVFKRKMADTQLPSDSDEAQPE